MNKKIRGTIEKEMFGEFFEGQKHIQSLWWNPWKLNK